MGSRIEFEDAMLRSSAPFEIVESKHRGHPDRICEEAAIAVNEHLAQRSQQIGGRIAHYQVDSVLLSAGQIANMPKDPMIVQPFRVIISGQVAPILFDDENFHEGIESAISQHFWNIYGLQLNVEYAVENLIASSSDDLQQKFEAGCCSDTAFVIGYHPATKLEQVSDGLESFFDFLRTKLPSIGQDVKIMLISRDPQTIEVIVAVAMIHRHLDNPATYRSHLFFIEHNLRVYLEQVHGFTTIEIHLNQADRMDMNEYRTHTDWSQIVCSSLYLTRSGFSAEHQDDGGLGRASRDLHRTSIVRSQVNEMLIGKNPRHSSVIYHALAVRISHEIFTRFEIPTEVVILSKIGDPLTQPYLVKIRGLLGGTEMRQKIHMLVETLIENQIY